MAINVHNMPSGSTYFRPCYHRETRRQNKSFWTISVDEEIDVFRASKSNDWCKGNVGWGVHITGNSVGYLGVAQDHTTKVFIAFFECKSVPDEWHGYPADCLNNSRQIPEPAVLNEWCNRGYLTRAKVSKIVKGKRCVL